MIRPRLLLVCLVVALSLVEGSETRSRVSYDGAQVLRVDVASKKNKRTLSKLEDLGILESWSNPAQNSSKIDVFVRPEAVLKVKQFFENKEVGFEVVNANLQNTINTEKAALSKEEQGDLVGKNGHQLTWNFYHSLQEIDGFLDYMATAHERCSLLTIGASTEGRPLRVLKIASGSPNAPAVWIDGGMHAREWITPSAVTYIINELVENRPSLPASVQGVDFYVLAVANPDGYEHTRRRDRLWRKNRRDADDKCSGVDLNRNFGYKWGGTGASTKQCRETYAGAAAFSEPETRAISQFITGKALKGYLSFHAYGQYILYPWSSEGTPSPDHRELRKVARSMGRAMRKVGNTTYAFGQAHATMYPASGTAEDWAKGTANIKHTYTVQLRDKGEFGFFLPPAQIKPTAQEAMAAAVELAKEIAAPVKKAKP